MLNLRDNGVRVGESLSGGPVEMAGSTGRRGPASTTASDDAGWNPWFRAAGFTRLAAVQSGTGRIITYQRAEFFLFRDNKILSYHAILDSFDLSEQMLGHAGTVGVANQLRLIAVAPGTQYTER